MAGYGNLSNGLRDFLDTQDRLSNCSNENKVNSNANYGQNHSNLQTARNSRESSANIDTNDADDSQQ